MRSNITLLHKPTLLSLFSITLKSFGLLDTLLVVFPHPASVVGQTGLILSSDFRTVHHAVELGPDNIHRPTSFLHVD